MNKADLANEVEKALGIRNQAQDAFSEQFSSQVIAITEVLSLQCRLNPGEVHNV